MSLKEEIEKIIRAERDMLEREDRQKTEFKERQHERFHCMRRLLEELATSIDAKDLNVSIEADSATVKVVTMSDAYFGTSWRIEPNFDFKPKRGRGDYLFHEAQGINVIDVRTSDREETHTFDDEETAMAYLVGKIAEQIAYHQHRNKLRGRP